MGFEYDDCEAALQNGKLTINEATEWFVILSCLNFLCDTLFSYKYELFYAAII